MGKAKISKEADADTAVLEYLRRTNRPYSAVDLFNNLKKVHGQTQIKKTLAGLAERGDIKEKEYGKQKVYVVVQDENDIPSAEGLQKLDADIKEMESKVLESTTANKGQSATLNSLNGQLTNEALGAELERLRAEVARNRARVEELKQNSEPLDPNLKERVEKDLANALSAWRKRRKICTNMLNDILEGYPKSKKELIEACDVETDEMVGVSLEGIAALQ